MTAILCFGDSITYGESDCLDGGWVSLLLKHFLRLERNGLKQETLVYNLGIASETTDGLKLRFNNELESRTRNKEITHVILSYGINDLVIHKNKNKVPVQYFERNLSACIEFAKEKNVNVILNSILPIRKSLDGIPSQHGDLRNIIDIKSYNQSLQKLAEEFDCVFNDLSECFESQKEELIYGTDGIHPTSLGHQLIYQKVIQLFDAVTL